MNSPGASMLRCLLSLVFLWAFSSPLCAQSVGGPNASSEGPIEPPRKPVIEPRIQTTTNWFARSISPAPSAIGEVTKAFLTPEHLSGQAATRTDMIIPRLSSEGLAGLSREILTKELGEAESAPQVTSNGNGGFHWASAFKQSLLFLGVQHGYAMTQAKTRRELRGPFIKDYFRSVGRLGGWADGGRFFTNYISHPMEGSITGFIQIQNDPRGIRQEFGKSRAYWKSRLKAMAWNAAYSTLFEIGPISQSSIGNVGLHTTLDGKKRKMAYVDLVVTPTLGTAWLIGEDILDRFVVRRLEVSTFRPLWRNTLRVILNPMRGAANMLRFKVPWYRDR